MQKLENPVVLFDGVCSLCNSSVQYILLHDKQKSFRFYSLQSEYARQLLAELEPGREVPDSLILYENGQIYVRSEAVIRIAGLLGGFFRLAAGFRIFPKSILDALYNFIAGNRYRWFGKKESCVFPDSGISGQYRQ